MSTPPPPLRDPPPAKRRTFTARRAASVVAKSSLNLLKPRAPSAKGSSGGGAIKLAREAHDTLQLKTFSRWWRSALPAGTTFQDLCDDMRDSSLLIKLLESLRGAPIPRVSRVPNKNRFQHLENFTRCLQILSTEQEVRLVNISAEDLADGKRKQVLALTWQLILHYELGGGGGGDSSLTMAELLVYVRTTVAGYRGCEIAAESGAGVWEHAFSDGSVLAALVDQRRPGRFLTRDLPRTAVAKLEAVFKAGLRRGAPALLDASDVANGEVDALSIMTYVIKLRHALGENGDAVRVQAWARGWLVRKRRHAGATAAAAQEGEVRQRGAATPIRPRADPESAGAAPGSTASSVAGGEAPPAAAALAGGPASAEEDAGALASARSWLAGLVAATPFTPSPNALHAAAAGRALQRAKDAPPPPLAILSPVTGGGSPLPDASASALSPPADAASHPPKRSPRVSLTALGEAPPPGPPPPGPLPPGPPPRTPEARRAAVAASEARSTQARSEWSGRSSLTGSSVGEESFGEGPLSLDQALGSPRSTQGGSSRSVLRASLTAEGAPPFGLEGATTAPTADGDGATSAPPDDLDGAIAAEEAESLRAAREATEAEARADLAEAQGKEPEPAWLSRAYSNVVNHHVLGGVWASTRALGPERTQGSTTRAGGLHVAADATAAPPGSAKAPKRVRMSVAGEDDAADEPTWLSQAVRELRPHNLRRSLRYLGEAMGIAREAAASAAGDEHADAMGVTRDGAAPAAAIHGAVGGTRKTGASAGVRGTPSAIDAAGGSESQPHRAPGLDQLRPRSRAAAPLPLACLAALVLLIGVLVGAAYMSEPVPPAPPSLDAPGAARGASLTFGRVARGARERCMQPLSALAARARGAALTALGEGPPGRGMRIFDPPQLASAALTAAAAAVPFLWPSLMPALLGGCRIAAARLMAAAPWPIAWRVPAMLPRAFGAVMRFMHSSAAQQGGSTAAVLVNAKKGSALGSRGGAGGLVAAGVAGAAALLRSGAASVGQPTAAAQVASRAAAAAARRVPQLMVTWANQNGAVRSFTLTLWPLRAAIGAP